MNKLINQLYRLVLLIKYVFQKVLFLVLLADIKCIYFVTKTGWGYSLYLSALAVVFGTKTGEAGLFFLLCFFFSCYVIGITFIFFFLVKVPRSRRYLQERFGEDYLVKHLGAHMMTREMVKVATGFAAIVAAEKAGEHLDRIINDRQASELEEGQKKLWKDNGYTPSMSEQQRNFEQANAIRHKPVQDISDQVWRAFKNIGGGE